MGLGHSHGTQYHNRDAVRAVTVSAVVLGFAALVEILAAAASHSASVLADGLHNSGDVLTTFVLLFAFRLARRPATRRFASGFGRIEDVATLLILVVIILTAGVAAWESVQRLLVPETYSHIGYSLAAAAIGIVANFAVSEYKIRVGRGLNSPALEADGIHSRIDALVSAAAFAGIGLAGLGLRLADPIAGLLITVAIIFVMGGTVRELFMRMMDAVDPELTAELTRSAMQVPGVLGVHDVRARWVGRQLVAVIHINCSPNATLQQAHALATQVEDAVCEHLPEARLDIHMDPGTREHHHAVVGTAEEGDEHDHEDGEGHGHTHDHGE
jgi:cation diffusion facilitator family transporter